MDGTSQQSSESRLRQYQALIEVAESIIAHRDLNSLLQELKKRLGALVNIDGAHVVLHDAKENVMRRYVLKSASQQGESLIAELPMYEAPSGLVWQTQQPLLINDLDAYQDRFARVISVMRESGLNTAYLLPLTSLDRKLGTVIFISRQKDAWSDDDRSVLQQATKLVALAVDNVVNFESARAAETELKRRLEQLRLLLAVGKSVASHLDLRKLIEIISDYVRKTLQCDAVWMALRDSEPDYMRVYALDPTFDVDARSGEGRRFPLEGTFAAKVLATFETLLLTREDLENSPSPFVRSIAAQGIHSGCLAPLISQGRGLGVVSMTSRRENAFTNEDAELFTQIAGQLAIAVDNALNFERARDAEAEAKRKSERLQMLLEINNALVSQLSLRELVRAISTTLRATMGYDSATVGLYDAETNQLRAYVFDLPENIQPIEEGTVIPLEGSVGGRAMESSEPVFINRADRARAHSEFDLRIVEGGIRSAGVLPLMAHGRKLGLLGVLSFREDAFPAADQELLGHVAKQIAIAVENALAFHEIETLKNKLTSEKLYLEDEIRTEHNFEELIGFSSAFKRILKQVETVAPTESAVLIRGETGTGKELLARAIHNLSARSERSLVKINCAAIPTGLIESELFGHEKGAFTGAITQRIGRFELAHKGTLFLDEVGDIPLELQPKLLRVLQEQEFERLGSTRTQKVDVRLIAATNCDLEQMVNDKKYRSDLYYRLNVFPITIPPLRERREDIPALVRFFAQRYGQRLKKRIDTISNGAMAALTDYYWPGNVRELQHFIERAVILSQGRDLEVSMSELKPVEQSSPASPLTPKSRLSTLEAAEREHIKRALEESNWVIGGPNGAAARLGLKRTTLQSRMQKLGIVRAGS